MIRYRQIMFSAAKRYLFHGGNRLGVDNFFATYSYPVLLKRMWIRHHTGFAPESYAISVTNRCNLYGKCKHCYYDNSLQTKSTDIDLDKINIIIDEMKNHFGIKFVTLTGGETTLNLLDLAKRRPDITFFAYTNGSLLDRNFCLKLEKLGNVIVVLTIIGKEKIHDEIRGTGQYKQVMAAVENLKSFSLMWGFSLNESKVNYFDIVSGNLLDELIRLGPYFFRMIPVVPSGKKCGELILSPEEFQHIGETIRRKRLSGVVIHDYITDPILRHSCMAGNMNFIISHDLKVSPCVFMDTFTPIEFSNSNSNIMDILINHHYFRNARRLANQYPCIILGNKNWRQNILTN